MANYSQRDRYIMASSGAEFANIYFLSICTGRKLNFVSRKQLMSLNWRRWSQKSKVNLSGRRQM